MVTHLIKRNWISLLSKLQAPTNLVLLACFAFLSVVFTADPFDVVPDSWLRKSTGAQQVGRIDPISEALLFGRIVKSQSEDGLGTFESMGMYSREGIPWSKRAILNETLLRSGEQPATTDRWLPYESEFGLQGMFATNLFLLSPLDPSLTLDLIRALCGLLLALSLTHLIYWASKQTGFYMVPVLALFLGFSPWLVAFADSPFWVLFLDFLPLNVAVYFLQREEDGGGFPLRSFALSLTGVFLINALSGYVYFSAVVAAAAVPLFYYWALSKLSPVQLITRGVCVGVAGICGFLISFLMLAARKASYSGVSLADSVWSNVQMALRRTLAPEDDVANLGNNFVAEPIERTRESLDASILEVVQYYWIQDIFPGVPFWVFAVICLAAGFFILSSSRIFANIDRQRRRLFALFLTFLFSLFAPMSWYVLGKAHAFIHTFWSSVLWYVPAMFFAALFLAFLGKLLLSDLAIQLRRLLKARSEHSEQFALAASIVAVATVLGWGIVATSQTKIEDRISNVLGNGDRYRLVKGWDAVLHGDWIYLIAKRCSAVGMRSRIRLNVVSLQGPEKTAASQKLDFWWQNQQMTLPNSDRFKDVCIARRLLPEGQVKQVMVSEQSSLYGPLWEAEFEPANHRGQ